MIIFWQVMSPVSATVMKTIRISRKFAKIAPKRGRKSPKYYQTNLEYSTSKNNREYMSDLWSFGLWISTSWRGVLKYYNKRKSIIWSFLTIRHVQRTQKRPWATTKADCWRDPASQALVRPGTLPQAQVEAPSRKRPKRAHDCTPTSLYRSYCDSYSRKR
jgi:hypothetical protein